MTVEFPERPKVVADVVARLADGRILHLEFQLSNDPRMHWRCFHYYGAIQELCEDAEVIQAVIYLGNGPMTMRSGIQRPNCDYRYQILNMLEFPAEVFLESTNDAERVLALLCQSPDPRETIRQVLTSWRDLPRTALLENLERLRTLSQLRGREIIAVEEIERMPFDLDITESILYKRGEARGVAMGQAQGVIVGEERGVVKGEARMLTLMLENRFGPLPESALRRLAEASIEQLERWGKRAIAGDLEDVFAE